MFDILCALLGPRTCPWCRTRSTDTPLDWLVDRIPRWMLRIWILPDPLIARAGIHWCNKHHTVKKGAT